MPPFLTCGVTHRVSNTEMEEEVVCGITLERSSLKMIRQNWPVLIFKKVLFIFGGTFPLLGSLLFSVNEPYKGAAVWHYCHFDSDETASLSLCVMHKPYDAVCRQYQLSCVILTLFIFFIIITSLKSFSLNPWVGVSVFTRVWKGMGLGDWWDMGNVVQAMMLIQA